MGVHKKSLRELSSGCSGVRTLETLLILDASWLVRPQKERRSIRVMGIGKFAIAAMMLALTELGELHSGESHFCLTELEFLTIQKDSAVLVGGLLARALHAGVLCRHM